jgi:dienelactone hydrolase
VVLLQHDLGGSKQAADLDGIAARCLLGGAAVASVDFPLHGERASPKLSRRFVERVTRAPHGEAGGEVGWLGAIAKQAVMDLARALDALAQQPELDPDRVVYAGVGLGATLGTLFCVDDPRPRAAALALCGAGVGVSELDSERCIGRIAPRPVLLVGNRGDSPLPARATESLFAAAAEPKQLHLFDGAGTPLPEEALAKIWSFLERNLQTRVA